MTALKTLSRRWLLAAACLLSAPAFAGPLTLVPYTGEGNVAVFDSSTGGWVGAVTQFSDPMAPLVDPVSLVSVVLFSYDALAGTLSGTFEFTTTDLAGSLLGAVTGTFVNPGVFATGGQLSLDYQIQQATGTLAGVTGYGLSFLNFDPAATGLNNYSEEGLAALAVPEPATLALFATGLLLVGAAGRRVRDQSVRV